MTQKEAIEALLKQEGKTKGVKQNAISQMLKRGNITVDTLYQICEILEYEITIQPKRRVGARPNKQIEIEGREREK